METSAHMKFKSVLLASLFMVLCLGEIANANENTTTNVQLHVPWNLLSERLRSIGQSNTSTIEKVLESEQLQVEGLDWNLTQIRFLSKLSIDNALVNETGASVQLSKTELSINVNQISVDQVIEREVGGINVRIHVKASCGPLAIKQSGASARGNFTFDWTHTDPEVGVADLDLQWLPGSWTFEPFKCEGPEGVDKLLHTEISKRLNDPDVFKPYLVSFLSSYLKSQTIGVLKKIRSPLLVKAGKNNLEVSVGALRPLESGVLAGISIGSNNSLSPIDQNSQPSAQIMASLPPDRPALIGDMKTLEYMISHELSNQPDSLSVDLQTVSAFKKLMKSRFLQFFVWRDLWNFPKTNPFFLRIQNPDSLALKKTATGVSTTLNLNAVLQAYRDSKWWSYVTALLPATASIEFSLKNGTLSYATTIDSLSGSIVYGTDYRKAFKTSGNPPASTVRKAMLGKQAGLSGSMTWPTIDLGVAGKFVAAELKWIDSKNFFISLDKSN
ncbi:MAG: hypothetical protein V4692_09920 [Bdellovibrionota bacterium]